MPTDITVPDLGDFKDVEVIDVLVKPGDQIDVDTPLLTIETEKATMDVPSTSAGVVKSLALKKGDRVSKGTLIGQIDTKGGAPAQPAAAGKRGGASETPTSTSSLNKEESQKNAAAGGAAAAGKRSQKSAEKPSEKETRAAGGGRSSPAAVSDITVPDLGDFKDVEVIDVLVKPGDQIDVDTPILTIETEKATMDVPSTAAGVIKSVALKKGDRVSKGSLIGQIEAIAGGVADTRGGAPEAPVSSSSLTKEASEETPRAQRTDTSSPPPKADDAGGGATHGAVAQVARSAGAAPSSPTPSARGQSEVAPIKSPAGLPPIDEAGFARAYASPSVRKFARELGADLGRVKGSGPKGRITPDDVKAFVKQALTSGSPATAAGGGGGLPKIPAVDFSKFGAIEVKPLSRIAKISGPRLQASWLNVPHVWQMDEADITELEDTRSQLKGKAAKEGIKLTPLAFIVRACVKALQEFPNVNSSLDPGGQNLILKQYIHLGFAADTPNGLVVPVIRDADKKDVYEIARDLAALSEKARAGKLSIAQMQGASFTISSLGGIGGTSFTPIINAPEVAILGVARSSMKPVYQDGQFVPRLILPFTFAYDHRVIDGAAGARFTTFLAEKLADVKGLLEAVP